MLDLVQGPQLRVRTKERPLLRQSPAQYQFHCKVFMDPGP